MDDERFDALARWWGDASRSRRVALTLLMGGSLGALLGATVFGHDPDIGVDARGKGNRQSKRRRDQAKRRRATAKERRQAKKRATGKDQVAAAACGVCPLCRTCDPQQGKCVPDRSVDGKCCPRVGGQSGACLEGLCLALPCRGPICKAQTCPDGCCDADGRCHVDEDAACGTGGAQCRACSNPTPICRNHVCAACTANDQCPATTLCDGGACLHCDVCATGCPYPTVQAAVADPNGPATIRICPGTYRETIAIARDLTLIGAGQGNDPDRDTILQGAGSSVVSIDNDGPHAVTLRMLRITGGTAGSGSGGGVVTAAGQRAAAVTMIDCTVTGNVAQSAGGVAEGGGIRTGRHTTLTLTRCTISDNEAPGFAGDGGGLFIGGDVPATLTDCTVSGNRAGLIGGGIFVANNAHLTLDGGTVAANEAGEASGGLHLFTSRVTLQGGATVTANTAGVEGGGIFNNGGVLTITAGSVSGNFAPPGTPNECVEVNGGTGCP
jgi:hypothetical protein